MNFKITILVLFLPLLLVSQQNIDTINVYTTQLPQKLHETGRSVTVIDRSQIDQIAATSIDEILQTVTGVEIQSRGGFGVQGDILLRGATFTQVLVLVDGMKINDPLTGHFNSYIPVTPAEIERIEVLRGPAAAMFGADAVGGVINIITRTFANKAGGLSLGGEINFGEENLIHSNQGFSMKRGKTSIGGGFSMNQSDGQEAQSWIVDSTLTEVPYRSFFDVKTVGFSVGHQLSEEWFVNARTSFDHRDFDARYFYTSSSFDKSVETVSNWTNHLQVRHIGSKGATDYNIAYKYNTDKFVFSPDFPSTNNHKTQYLNLVVNHTQMINDDLSLKFGGQVDRRTIESNDRGDHEDLHYGLYASGLYKLNNLNLSLSLRGDYDDNYELEVTPQFNASYALPNVVFRAGAGRSIRAADYTERYVSNTLVNLTPGRSLGNPDLKAESGWSEEMGIDLYPTKYFNFKTTAFARQSDNLIDYVETNQSDIGSVSEVGSLQEGADYFFAKNISNVNTVGVEAETNWSLELTKDIKLKWKLGYTYLKTSNDDDVISVYISSHANHLVSSDLQLEAYGFSLGFSSLFKERDDSSAPAINQELKSEYFVNNLQLGYKLLENVGLNLQIQNVFDERYYNILGAKMPSRWIMAGLKWNI